MDEGGSEPLSEGRSEGLRAAGCPGSCALAHALWRNCGAGHGWGKKSQ